MKGLLSRWMGESASAHGPALDQMNALVHWLMALLFVGWSLYFIVVLFRFRAGRNPEASYTGTKSHFSTWTEGGIVLIEAILLIGFGIPAWARWVTPHSPEDDAVVIRVVGQQFAWNIHYPGADGVFGPTELDLVDEAINPIGLDRSAAAGADDIVAINQLHLPVDRPATLLLSSKDVIHSFFLPPMRVKQDVIPGQEIPVHFVPTRPSPEDCKIGQDCWEIACSQLCGLGHYRMRGFFTVHEEGGYEAWLASKAPKKPEPQPAPAAEPADSAAEPAEPAADAMASTEPAAAH